MFSDLAPYLTPVRRDLLIALLCSLGAVAMVVARPWPIKMLFDYALLPDDKVKWVFPYAKVKGFGASGVAGISCLLLVGISLLWGWFNYLQRYLLAGAGQTVTAGIRRRLFDHLQRLSLAFHRRNKIGDLLLRVTGDANMLRDMMVDSVLVLMTQGLVVVAMLVVMLAMDWRLTMVALAVLPLLALSVFRISGNLRSAVRKQRKREGRMAAQVGGMLQSVAVIQAFAREEFEAEKFAAWNKRNLRSGLRTVRYEASLERWAELVVALGTGGVLWLGTGRVLSGELTPGDLLVFSAYLAGLYKPLRKIARVTGRIAKAQSCAARVFEVLHHEERVRVSRQAVPAPEFEGRVSFKDVGFSYNRGVPVLRGVSFTIKPGHAVGVVGPNGAGKSTLCSLLPRLYDVESGSISIDGTKITRVTLESLRDQIGVVLQEPLLFAGTIRENIAYGKPDATAEEILAAASAADLDGFVSGLREGYETRVGERGETLSGGQRQKIAIARALVKNPKILVLDEPTAHLDASSAASLTRILRRVAKDRTTLYVSHRLLDLRWCKRVAVLEDGLLTSYGTHEELMETNPWYRKTEQLQSGAEANARRARRLERAAAAARSAEAAVSGSPEPDRSGPDGETEDGR